MLTREQNRLLTETGPGTPGGELLRRYWQPVGLSEEIGVGSAPKPVRILSEKLVLFRDEDGSPALLGSHCPHRGVDLSYGRIEDGGLRCLYHGWLFSKDGRCLEQPGEPAENRFKDRVRQTAYPTHEANGLIFAYFGPGEPPPIPKFPFLVAQNTRVWATKIRNECNYLQGNEGNVDPQHLSFLHRFFNPGDVFSKNIVLLSGDVAPRLIVEEASFGLRAYAVRRAGPDTIYVRISNFVMPNGSLFKAVPLADPKIRKPGDNDGCQAHWHVPIDDVSHYKYVIVCGYDGDPDREYLDRTIKGDVDEGYTPRRSASNRYQQNRSQMLTQTYAGMGDNFQDHDRFAIESEGAIFDRSTEHLGTTDTPVIAMRRQMLVAIEDIKFGRDPLMIARDSAENPVAELVTRSELLPADAPISGFWKSVSPLRPLKTR